MRKLIEMTHVSLGGEIDPLDWAFPYLDDEHTTYVTDMLFAADALLLGRRTYEGLSAAYPAMPPNRFVTRMNTIAKHVASHTLRETTWNATVIDADVVSFVAELKQRPGKDIVKYGNGPLSALLMRHDLIDEFHLLLTPVATTKGRHLFEDVDGAPALDLVASHRFASGVLALVYTPKPRP
jgi:dihydrofolate reductase